MMVGNTEILVGDALQTVGLLLPDKSIQCVVTSPPYFGLRDYGVDGQIGLEQTPQAYVEKLVSVFREVRRALRDDGTVWLNLGDSYVANRGNTAEKPGFDNKAAKGGAGLAIRKHKITGPGLKEKDLIGIPWRVAFALQADGCADAKACATITRVRDELLNAYPDGGAPDRVWSVIERLDREYRDAKGDSWYLRQDIIWYKRNPMPESVRDRCTKAHEYIFMLTKSPKYYYDSDAIAEPLASTSIDRLSQANIENQQGSNRVPGKTNGAMKAVAKQDGHGRRHAGFNARYFGSDKPYTGESTKDYEAAGAQDASATKRRIVDRILAGEIVTRNKRSVWDVTTKPFKGAHFATFPPDLIEPCILAGSKPGDTVLDPFGGSGTTALVANKHGRNAILIELNPEYVEIAKARLEKDIA